MILIKKITIIFIPLFIVVTGLSALSYLLVQQDIRIGANTPLIQAAENTANSISMGNDLTKLKNNSKIDLAKNLATFIMVYDSKRNPIISIGTLHSDIPQVPTGVFNYVDANGEDSLTWEPETGVRLAIVVTKFNTSNSSGYVVAGRSLRVIENNENVLELDTIIAWIIINSSCLIMTTALAFLLESGNIRKSE